MKRLTLLAVLMLACTIGLAPVKAGSVDPNLEVVMNQLNEGETVEALVYMWNQVDLVALHAQLKAERASRHERHYRVVTALRELAEADRGPILARIKELYVEGKIESYRPFKAYNIIRIRATPEAIIELAAREDVDTVYLNYEIELIEPVDETPSTSGVQSDLRVVEDGVVAVNAPEVWDLGFTGTGVLVANMDTGVAGDHEALASRWAGVADPNYAGHPEWAWYDPYNNQNTFPYDTNSHGTHTMGSVCGGAPGDEIGVAPGALWIASAPIDRGGGVDQTVADALLSFEWMLDPDGDPNTSWDVPHVCSNSWGVRTSHGYPDCDQTFWAPIDANEAAGTIILFSAGNEGPSATSLRRPGDRATTEFSILAVASIDPHNPSYPAANSSSRGPTFCTPDGSAAIKPDIAAPGVNIRSAMPSGGYANKSGTSMASPHVNGVVALMLQACPDLTSEEVKQIIYDTAMDLGDEGKDNTYGYGLIDALEAVTTALGYCGESPPRIFDASYEIAVAGQQVIELEATDYDGGPNPISFKIVNLPAKGTLMDMGDNHVIEASDLPYTLVNNGNAVQFTGLSDAYGADSFEFVANDGGVPPEGGDSDVGVISILLLYGPPTIATSALPDGAVDTPYTPVMLQADEGQPELVWTFLSDLYSEVDLGVNNFAAVGTNMDYNADDNVWSYTLPFSFPFYGQLRDSLWISSNGYIDFENDDPWQHTNTTQLLIDNVRIAPLWDDLRTDILGSDIYIDESTPGQVTIRWDAVTYSGSHATDFSVTLFADGVIELSYSQTSPTMSPTVGVSSGDGNAYMLSMYDAMPDLSNVNTVKIFLPSPLPEGMELDTTGEVHGTPTEAGLFEPVVVVTDSLGRTDQRLITLQVLDSFCPLDFDNNGSVGPGDVGVIKNQFGCDTNIPDCAQFDLDQNGAVGPGDVGVVKNAFGPCP